MYTMNKKIKLWITLLIGMLAAAQGQLTVAEKLN